MNDLLHRGNDDNGIWIKEDKKLALGHQRLAILDLSSKGHQPIESSSKRYIMIFNGEIYNHLELRKEIADKRNKKKLNKKNGLEIQILKLLLKVLKSLEFLMQLINLQECFQ